MKTDLYSEVSARIIAELERGAAPWIKPWSATPGANTPCNAVSARPYSGCNVVLLWMAQAAGYRTPRFLTFKQALELGGNVRKGEHGTKVYFVKQLQVADRTGEEGETRIVPMMREYTAFNVDQCESLPDRVMTLGDIKPRNRDDRDATIDDFMACSGATIREGAGEAYYRPGDDFISLPRFDAFKSAAHFYGVAFHELGHWTGHKSRLDRDLRHRFGDRAYAAEELVAELSAAFLCAEFSIDGDLRHSGYIASWISLLKADSRAFFTACSKAQAAADFLRGLRAPRPRLARRGRDLPPPALAGTDDDHSRHITSLFAASPALALMHKEEEAITKRTTKGRLATAKDYRDLDFKPMLRDMTIAEFQSRLNDFCVQARIAFFVNRQTKSQLIKNMLAADEDTVDILMQQTEDGHERAKALLNFACAARIRMISAATNKVEMARKSGPA
jgi:antirestriction protein ArdC